MIPSQLNSRSEIGDRLHDERNRLGYSDKQIANLLAIPLSSYQECRQGTIELSSMQLLRLMHAGFDILFIVSGHRYQPIEEELILLRKYRKLSSRGKESIFTTLDALLQLSPNVRKDISTS